MFLVTPKRKANDNSDPNPHASRPIAKITAVAKVARVQTACDRCRMKKVKCDGDLPCLRCSQDKLFCVTTKKVSNDPKGGLREYVHSMESQQTRLIEALRKLHRHVKQPIDEEDMQEILQTARACGFDFEGVQDIQYNTHESNSPPPGHDNLEHVRSRATNGFHNNKDTNGEEMNSVMDWGTGHDCLGKRKRAEFGQLLNTAIAPDSDVPVVGNFGDSLPDTSEVSDVVHESETSPLKRQKPAAPAETVDDYWNFDSNFDQVTTPYKSSKPPIIPTEAFSNSVFDADLQIVSDPLQQPSELPAWSWNDLSQPLTTTHDDPTFEANRTTNTHPIEDSTAASSNFDASHDGGSTMWWDPSLLFDTGHDNLDLDGGGLPTWSF